MKLWWMVVVAGGLGTLGGCAGTITGAADATWYEARTARFSVLSHGDPDKARALAADLERFHHVMLSKTTAEERFAAPPLRVFVTHSLASYHAFGGPKDTIGQFKATSRGNFALVADVRRAGRRDTRTGSHVLYDRYRRNIMTARNVLFHEYVHYLQAQAGAKTPSWYREGVAEYMANTEFAEDGGYTLGCPPRYRTAGARYLSWIPMDTILRADSLYTLSGTGQDSYAQAWFAVHYFSADTKRERQLARYLELWADGASCRDAARQAFGLSLPALDGVLKEYSIQSSFECATVQPAHAPQEPTVRLRKLDEAAAHLHLADMLLGTVGPVDNVFELLNKARRQAPADPRVLTALARAELMRVDRATGSDDSELEGAARLEALEPARELIMAAVAQPTLSPEALAVEGHVRAARARAMSFSGEAGAAAELAAARKAYRRAVRADESLAEAYSGLGRTYLMADNGSQEAVVVLEAAAYLTPLDLDIPLALSELHLRRGDRDKALPPLRYAAMWLKDPTELKRKIAALVATPSDASTEDAPGAPQGSRMPTPATPTEASDDGHAADDSLH